VAKLQQEVEKTVSALREKYPREEEVKDVP
jgi:hypothetical protein